MTSAEVFSKALLDVGNEKIPVDPFTGLISFPANSCQSTTSKEELISKVFPKIDANYKNYAWLSKRVILTAKNKDVDELNKKKIQSQISGQIHSYKSIESITDPNEVVN